MPGNAVTLTFAGDATKLEKAAARAAAATTSVGDAAAKVSKETDDAGKSAAGYTDRMARAGAAAAGMSAAIGDAGGTVSALAALQNRGADRAQAQARALADVEQAGLEAKQALGDLRQAQVDLNQAQLDAKQAGADAQQALIDQKQATLDVTTAQDAYNKAVKEHGKGSIEARQAAVDLAQAQQDLKQAGLDAEQSQVDLKQAQEDAAQAGRDMAQANRDAQDATLNLTDAQKAADPGTLARWGTEIETVSTAALGLVGIANLLAMANNAVSLSSIRAAAATTASKVAALAGAAATGIATAAQWAWNVAMSANPIGLVILAVGALVAAIVWVATQTTWFQDLWETVWDAIVAYITWVRDNYVAAFNFMIDIGGKLLDNIKAIPGRLKSAFSGLFDIITWPFRTAFNFIADAWNNTIGRLSWSVPGWVPFVGGNTIAAPQLPKFHQGGIVPGAPGTEVPIMALAGERVTPPGQSGSVIVLELRGDGSRRAAWLIEELRAGIRDFGGDPVKVLTPR
jgi:hypothetical protein